MAMISDEYLARVFAKRLSNPSLNKTHFDDLTEKDIIPVLKELCTTDKRFYSYFLSTPSSRWLPLLGIGTNERGGKKLANLINAFRNEESHSMCSQKFVQYAPNQVDLDVQITATQPGLTLKFSKIPSIFDAELLYPQVYIILPRYYSNQDIQTIVQEQSTLAEICFCDQQSLTQELERRPPSKRTTFVLSLTSTKLPAFIYQIRGVFIFGLDSYAALPKMVKNLTSLDSHAVRITLKAAKNTNNNRKPLICRGTQSSEHFVNTVIPETPWEGSDPRTIQTWMLPCVTQGDKVYFNIDTPISGVDQTNRYQLQIEMDTNVAFRTRYFKLW